MSTPEVNLPFLDYRMGRAEEDVKSLRHWRGTIDVRMEALDLKLDNLSKDVAELSDAVIGLRRTVMVFSFTVASSSVVFAFSILAAVGRI